MDIQPFESLGELRFGSTREETRKVLGGGFESFMKGPFEKSPTDAYDNLGLHLYFDEDDRLEFIEGWDPAVFVFNGISFLGRDPKAVDRAMREMGHIPESTDNGLQYNSAGIVFTDEGENGCIDSVAVFRRGYYDDHNVEELMEKLREHFLENKSEGTQSPENE